MLYDSTGVLGKDDRKNTYSKMTQEHGFGSQIDHILMTKRELKPEQFPLYFFCRQSCKNDYRCEL